MANHTCSICNSDKASAINALLAGGKSPHWIEGEMKRTGRATKAETIRRHVEKCLSGDLQAGVINEALATGGGGMSPADFAVAVRDKAHEMLSSGELKVRTEHGLQAQALLDRRAEKAADRNLQVELARLLAGGMPNFGAIPDDLIEGEWREVKDVSPPLELVASAD